MRLYEWDAGTVRLAGVLPGGAASDASFAGQGVEHLVSTPGVISDGSDGHSRIFFTQPTDVSGATLTQVGTPGEARDVNASTGGNLFVRVDHASTEQLNVSERTGGSAFAPATFQTASSDGTRSFFTSAETLTDDASAGGQNIYMYDGSKPASDPHNLTLVTVDEEPADGVGDALGVIGASDDGHYLYFAYSGQLINGDPAGGVWLYVWHDGQIARIAPSDFGPQVFEQLATGVLWALRPRQARVSPDGRTLLFSSITSLTGYDHGSCDSFLGTGCRELYVYDAADDSLACASCNPTGAPATGMATTFFGENLIGGTRADAPNDQALTADGARVFFSTPEALVPDDTNQRIDAYEYDVASRSVALLTTGKSTADSYFVNADPSGENAFVITREQLVGWDKDGAYDVYDARVGGGFPEPPPSRAPCDGSDACRGLSEPGKAPYTAHGSAVFDGTGNRASHPSRRLCRRGRKPRRVHGRRRW